MKKKKITKMEKKIKKENEKVLNWKLGKVGISEKLSRVFLFPSFRFCRTAKIENSDLKISGKKFRDFQGFRVSDLAKGKCLFSLFIGNLGYGIEINRQIDFGWMKVVNKMNYVKIICQDLYQVKWCFNNNTINQLFV